MKTGRKSLIILLNMILVLALAAQVNQASFIRYNKISTGLFYQTWSSENDDRVSEWILPITYILPVNRQLSLDFSNIPTMASLSGVDKNLSGLTDTRIRFSYVTMNDKMLITGGISLPTGKSQLEAQEFNIASALAINALDFRIPTLGQGLDLKFSAAFAQEFGSVVLGGGVGYLSRGAFKPYKGSDLEYNPGDEFTLTLGMDKNFEMGGNPAKLMADFSYTLYGADKSDNTETFKSGNKLFFEIRSLFKFNSADMLVFARNRSKGKNERGLGSLSTESSNSNGNQLDLGTIGYFPLGPTTRMKGLFDTKIYSKNEYETNGAFVMGIGSGFEFQLSERFVIDTQFKFLKGSLKNRKSSTGITGIEAGAFLILQL
ncbi:MAG: hypothetical protein Kow0042_32010 [Calditrichia bacterium]